VRSEGDFDALYEASRDRLVRQLFALTDDLAGAEDLVQEAFVRTWMAWARVSSCASPEAFVRQVAFDLAKSWWRLCRP
jgi:RNA polymerase sigma-70 factor (ECF subfamily)